MAILQQRVGFTRDRWMSITDNTSAGALNNVSTNNLSTIRFTAATSISGFANGYDGKELEIINDTASQLTILNDNTSSSIGNRIYTATGADFPMSPNTSIRLRYVGTMAHWVFVSGGGGGANYVEPSSVTVASGGTITPTLFPIATIIVEGLGGSPITTSTTPFGTTPITDGSIIILVGNSNVATVTIPTDDVAFSAWLDGDCTLNRGKTLTVQYISSLNRYVEICRTNTLIP